MPEQTLYIKNKTGLNKNQVQSLRQSFGKNIFRSDRPNSFLHSLADIIREPMFILLLLACFLYFILGETQNFMMMLGAVIFVAAISVLQEIRSSNALLALRKLTEPQVIVVRDNEEQTILSEDLLPGDVMILEEGNRVPADAIIIQSNDLSVNESVITGESFAVDKNAENQHQLFQGTIINSGKCYAEVTSTGNNTMLGKLGKSINTISSPKTPLQKQIGRFVTIMAVIGLCTFSLIWFLNFLQNGSVLKSMLYGLTLAMSIIPEEIPVAFSSFMALGAYRMAKLGIITRQPQIIENLGAVSVICLDKTGTITENKMQLKTIYDYETDHLEELDGAKKLNEENVLYYARLASEAQPFDAMEKAIVEAFHIQYGKDEDEKIRMVHEYPLAGKPPMMTHVYQSGDIKIVAGKGAPERILRICKIDPPDEKKIIGIVKKMAANGQRVLAVCSSIHTAAYPTEQDDFNWKFEGLLSLYDPPKKNAGTAFSQWYDAGIRIKLLTGDYAETAMNIANQVGLINNRAVLVGNEVMQFSADELKKQVLDVNIFARMFPEAKLKVIEAIRQNDEIVGMIGDGVNDGPALKSANIGIAMGDKGTEIAKSAAGLVISDDNLEKLSDAIGYGRKIYSNLKKAISYIVSIHIPIILTASLPLILGWKYPNIFTPVHIIFLELIMGPTCSIFYEMEPAEKDIMKKKPRKVSNSVFHFRELVMALVQGLVIAGGLLGLYYYFMENNFTIEYTRAMVFTTLLFSNVFLTFANRSLHRSIRKTFFFKNSLTPFVIIFSAIFIGLIHFVKPVQDIFKLESIQPQHFLVSIGVSICCVMWFELYKIWRE